MARPRRPSRGCLKGETKHENRPADLGSGQDGSLAAAYRTPAQGKRGRAGALWLTCPLDRPRDCSRHCPNIPQALSSDPENYPIENGIAPLVFEVNRLGVFDTCWSCEGHNGPDGKLWKTPKVWFRAESQVHLGLLGQCLHDLRLTGAIKAVWQVTLVSVDDQDVETLFCMEPRIEERATELSALQADAQAIAARLPDLMVKQARNANACL